MSTTVLFQAIQFSISTQFSSIWPIDRTLSGANTPGQSGPGSNGNNRVLCIPQSFSITGTSLSDYLVSYPGHSLVGGGLTPLLIFSRYILLPQPNGQDNYLSFQRSKLDPFQILILIRKNNNPHYVCMLSRDGSRRRGGGNDTPPPLN